MCLEPGPLSCHRAGRWHSGKAPTHLQEELWLLRHLFISELSGHHVLENQTGVEPVSLRLLVVTETEERAQFTKP